MFINIIEFPAVKEDKDQEFRQWFEWSNTVYAKFEGFISRRLLKPTEGTKNYAAIVEHESRETFMAMHLSDERQEAWKRVEPLLEGAPIPNFYEVLLIQR